MSRFFTLLAAFVMLGALLTGCRSTAYYQNQAVERAREYLLAHSPELTPVQVAFVRYNKPTFLVENIFASESVSSDLSQICITWLIPGQENVYLVYGVSEMRMASWSPNRLIRKVFPPVDKARMGAIGTARNYAMNNLYFELTPHQYNLVRFADPEIMRTAFVIDTPNPSNRPQYSMVWECGDPDRRVVVCGLANENLGGFAVSFGGILTTKEIADNLPPEVEELPAAEESGESSSDEEKSSGEVKSSGEEKSADKEKTVETLEPIADGKTAQEKDSASDGANATDAETKQ